MANVKVHDFSDFWSRCSEQQIAGLYADTAGDDAQRRVEIRQLCSGTLPESTPDLGVLRAWLEATSLQYSTPAIRDGQGPRKRARLYISVAAHRLWTKDLITVPGRSGWPTINGLEVATMSVEDNLYDDDVIDYADVILRSRVRDRTWLPAVELTSDETLTYQTLRRDGTPRCVALEAAQLLTTTA